MVDIAFLVFAAITLLSALVVVLHKKLLYSAIALLFTFFGIAGLYIFLWADFLAGVQVVIYIGGILVLIIFGIMLTNKITSIDISHGSMQRGIAGVVVLAVLSFLGYIILHSPWKIVESVEPTQTAATIGNMLMMEYLLPFEVASLLLLAALIGAAMLSRKDE